MDALIDALIGMGAVVVVVSLLANIAVVFRQLWSLIANRRAILLIGSHPRNALDSLT